MKNATFSMEKTRAAASNPDDLRALFMLGFASPSKMGVLLFEANSKLCCVNYNVKFKAKQALSRGATGHVHENFNKNYERASEGLQRAFCSNVVNLRGGAKKEPKWEA